MADMIVAGAGYSAANGTYTEISPVNSHSAWQYNTCYIMWGSGPLAGRWIIKSDNDPSSTGNLLYYTANASSYATPADAPSWTVWSSTYPPAPTVTAASSGTTHEGEATLSSLSYLRTKKA